MLNKTVLAELARVQTNTANILGKIIDLKEDLTVTEWFIKRISKNMVTQEYLNEQLEKIEASCYVVKQVVEKSSEINDLSSSQEYRPKEQSTLDAIPKFGKVLKYGTRSKRGTT